MLYIFVSPNSARIFLPPKNGGLPMMTSTSGHSGSTGSPVFVEGQDGVHAPDGIQRLQDGFLRDAQPFSVSHWM